MGSTYERAVSVAAAKSSASQFGPESQRRQLALELYVAAIAGEDPSQLRTPSADDDVSPRAHQASAGDLTVSSIMGEAISLATTTSPADVLRALTEHAATAIPVVDEDGVAVGVVSEADLLARVVAYGGRPHIRPSRTPHTTPDSQLLPDLTAGDLMTSPAITTSPDDSLTQAAVIAAHAHVKVLPVVDAGGRVVGLVSRSDILGAFLRESHKRSTNQRPAISR